MSEKIRPEHLQRAAYVYVRQSSPYQVRHHLESQQRQYGLAERARQLGFAEVVVIDEDLGRSGSGLQERPGFGRLLAAVCQGGVGAVLALEASRLARNNRDWYHLVDLCALTDTLLLDEDGIYDPKLVNDRLLLGLKGTMSEFELGLLRQRARLAYLQKVRRGCVLWEVPVGYVRTEQGQLEKTPDRQVRQALETVFAKFKELGSMRQSALWLVEHQILLPRAISGRSGQVSWQAATQNQVYRLLRNPCYAGALAYGRSRSQTQVVEGRAQHRRSRRERAPEQWEVLIRDHHEAYLSWEEYLKNRQQMSQNRLPIKGEAGGAVRRGAALLSGLLRCGHCGRRLHVAYSSDGLGRYICVGDRRARGTSPCLSLAHRRTDAAVVAQALAALAPAGIEAALQCGQEVRHQEVEQSRAVELALEKARYEAQRAQRQFDAVEPENRLVAAELENRWNQALAQVSALEERLKALGLSSPQVVSSEQKQRLMELGQDLQQLWEHPQAPLELKKRILRTIIQEIVASRPDQGQEHCLQIHWAGGAHTAVRVARNRRGIHGRMADSSVIGLVRELAKVCDDAAMVAVLNRLKVSTGAGNCWSKSRLASFRYTHGIAIYGATGQWISLLAAAQQLRVSYSQTKQLITQGLLPARQMVKGAPWVIEAKDLELPAVRAAIGAVHQGKQVPSSSLPHPELPIK